MDKKISSTRINKYMAECGVASRRGADALILAGRVRLNGQPVSEPGVRVVPGKDVILVDGKALQHPAPPLTGEGRHLTLMLHKPREVLTTRSDPQGRRTVYDLLPAEYRGMRLLYVGRLDYFSEGLLLLTTDGELLDRLIRPRWHLPKIYHVLVRGEKVDEARLAVMRRGMTLTEGERLAPVPTRLLSRNARGTWLELTLEQGVNRQIRRMCRDLDLTILRLIRVRQGPVRLDALPPGKCRPLAGKETDDLRRAVGLPPESA